MWSGDETTVWLCSLGTRLGCIIVQEVWSGGARELIPSCLSNVMADPQADRYRLDSPTSSVEENCDVEEGKAASPRLPEAKDEEASAESVFSRVAEAEIMGGDHDKRLVFDSDSESSDEEEEDDIRGRDEGFEMSNLATVLDLLGEDEDEVNYSGSEQQMDEEDKRDNLSSPTRTVENDNTKEREAKNDEQLTVV